MGFAHFFVDRPIFASVVSIFIVLVGAAAYLTLPVAQYPEIVPPTIQITASYPGASAETVSGTVATPLEQEINGVDNMLYMVSQATADGELSLTVTFALGTDLDTAQVLVQNRVAIAEPRLPEEVRRLGVTVRKNSPDMLMVIHLNSPDQSRDQLYISNYATLQVRDVLSRIAGVGDVRVFGARNYAMRIWLDPEKVAARELTAGEVLTAIRSQNVQVASGVLNQPPIPNDASFQLNVETEGRFDDTDDFERIVVKTDPDGRVTRISDIGHVELGAQDYSANGYLDERPAVPLLIFQRPGSNALATAEQIINTMQELAEDFPEGLQYNIVYNPTEFVAQSVDAVKGTIYEAVVLVVLVMIVFLQSWRTAIVPIVAIPVSLIGTFAFMAALGFSINNLTLFGLVLAIGIVVDDAIVVVENVERNLRAGLSPRDAAHRTIDEVAGPIIATFLVLAAVFVPAALIPGISGQFFRQFAVTIAVSTALSTWVSLSLSPALCALLLKPHEAHAQRRTPLLLKPVSWFFAGFNWLFERFSLGYGGLTKRLVRIPAIVLVVYAGLIGLTGWQFARAPVGFIPEQDQGYLITVLQLPPGASLGRTDEVVRKATQVILDTPGVEHAVPFAGFDGATFTNAPNAGAIFSALAPFEERAGNGLSAPAILQDLNARLSSIQEAFIITIMPPPVRGIGTGGGFKMMIEDRRARGVAALDEVTEQMVAMANQQPGLANVFSVFNTRTPNIFADIDLVRAEMLGVTPERVFETLEVYLGSAYVNDFNYLGRIFQVRIQADGAFRQSLREVGELKTRSAEGGMVPLSSVASFRDQTGPYRLPRYNLYPAAEVQGATMPGTSTGEALERMEALAEQILPAGFDYEWTELALQEKQAGNTGLLVFFAAAVCVFLVLAAQYESWTLPLAVILIVPMCLLAAVSGLSLRGIEINILAQIGFVVLVGLAAKNAILIVEFARQRERAGRDRFQAAIEAAQVRMRPILMTSFAFIFGVLPLAIATGAAAEMRQALGTAVFFGMLGVTFFGLIFTPVFYVVARKLARS
jgi:HAE1 family hydrophobic/amphiphilic exporter-1